MTIENWYSIGMTDIFKVQFECKNCNAMTSFHPDKWERLTEWCPNCQKQWFVPGSIEAKAITGLTGVLADLRRGFEGLGCQVSFQVKLPSQK